ncbi:MAG: GHKL domain-containing protein [Flavobacteriaceae bacterium]|nr:GHKL domain-containing protein [Flavobacteriaceae bacterium]
MNPLLLKIQRISLYNTTLFFILIGLLGNIIGYKRSYDLDMVYASVVQTVIILLALLVFKVKNYTSPESIVSLIIVLMILYGASGMLFYGFSASGKFLLFLGPLFFAEYLSFRKYILLFIIGLITYLLIILLITYDIVLIHIDHNQYVEKVNSWVIDGFSLFVISYSGLLIKMSSKKMSQGYSKELEKSDDRFQQIFKNSNEAIILLKDYVIYDCNKNVLELFECDMGFLKEKHMLDLCSPSYKGVDLDRSMLDKMTEKIEFERVKLVEWETSRPNGELIVLEVSFVNVEKVSEEFQYTQAILRNVTDRRNKEIAQLKYQKILEEQVLYRTEELVKLNGDLLKTNRDLEYKHQELMLTIEDLNNAKDHLIQSEKMASIGVLTAGVAHEINNPLNFIQSGIYSFENILENGHLMGTEEELRKIQRRVLDQMNEGVSRVTNIVKGLNRFSRDNKVDTERCDLNEVIENCLLILNHESKDNCNVITDFFIGGSVIISNEGKLHQVFVNVLHNAIQSIQSIESDGEIKITTQMNSEGTKVIVTIQDNGCGIAPENLKKVFDPFYTTKRASHGTGLGLAIVYNILREQQATVEVTSVLGEGTLFTFVFTRAGEI